MLTLSIHQTYLTNSTKKDILNMPHIHTEKGQHDHTASAFILKHDIKKNEFRILLHMHKKYGKLLQPGGHIELHESPWEAILHELVEETGYNLSQLSILQPESTHVRKLTNAVVHPVPLCHNTHWADEEHTHKHTDISYLFITTEEPEGLPGEDESADLRWVTLEELEAFDDSEVSSISREVSRVALKIAYKDEWWNHSLAEFS